LAGCGSGGSNTNGTLNLDVATTAVGAQVVVEATASYTNATTQGAPPPINISMSFYSLTGGTRAVLTTRPFGDLTPDTTGTVKASQPVAQGVEDIYVDVVATTGGLSRTKTVLVPHL
jgi:hypothetical protein